ncbi:hypothetical protein MYX84_01145 [Acidobacteria bacterium AH-259-O06]|nr:hypothetical protein [Acidobacteria bacterium AH-259-O06]
MGKLAELIKGKFKDRHITEPDPNPSVTDQMPTVPYRVLYTNIPFYSDTECKNEVAEAKIVILEALDPDEPYKELDIAPTLKNYKPGQLVTWTSNNKKLWEESWYKHPETGQIEQAWTFHVGFTGELISERTLKENKEILEEIEAKLAAQAEQEQQGKQRIH